MSDSEIAMVTSYIKDDRYIASIYGTNIHRVKRLRESYEKKDIKGVTEMAIGMDCVNRHNLSMEIGSTALLKSILRARGIQQ